MPYFTWWRHQMETFSALLAIFAGNSPVTGEFPAQRPVTRSIDIFFDLCLNKWLSKQWWFETRSRPLWCHCNQARKRHPIAHFNSPNTPHTLPSRMIYGCLLYLRQNWTSYNGEALQLIQYPPPPHHPHPTPHPHPHPPPPNHAHNLYFVVFWCGFIQTI